MMIAGLGACYEPPPIAPIRTREDLIDALGRAAELEHAIMCQYLYAAFSLKTAADGLTPDQIADAILERG